MPPLIQLVAALNPALLEAHTVPPPCPSGCVPDGFCRNMLPPGLPAMERATAKLRASVTLEKRLFGSASPGNPGLAWHAVHVPSMCGQTVPEKLTAAVVVVDVVDEVDVEVVDEVVE